MTWKKLGCLSFASNPGHTMFDERDSVAWGFFVWLGITIVVYFVLFAIGVVMSRMNPPIPGRVSGVALTLFFQPGLWQLLYVIPLVFAYRRQKRFQTAKGLVIFASALFILDALCLGALYRGS